MGNFIKYNRHPEGKNVKDCVIRAISTAFNKNYLETRKECNLAKRELGYESYTDHDFIYDYLKKCEILKFKATKGEARYKLCEFANDHPRGSYIVKVRHHVVAVVEGVVLDTWDSTYLTVYTAWKINPDMTLEELNIDKTKAETKRKKVFF